MEQKYFFGGFPMVNNGLPRFPRHRRAIILDKGHGFYSQGVGK